MAQNLPTDWRKVVVEEAARWKSTAEDPPGSNRSLVIDFMLTLIGSPLASQWCGAFVYTVFVLALGRLHAPRISGSVRETVALAEKRGAFTKNLDEAKPGDLLVLFYPSLQRWGHIAIIERVNQRTVASWDGNTARDAAPGSPADREGVRVANKVRPRSERMGVILVERWMDAA